MYLKLIWLSLGQKAEWNQKPTDFACPILSQEKQLWDIPEHRESLTLYSA